MFVTNDDVVLNDTSQVGDDRSLGFQGWSVCVLMIRYSRSHEKIEKMSALLA